MCAHAGPVGALRPVRRPPPPDAAAAHRSPPWSGCSRRWASPPPAVRTAVSRMVRQGWLDPLRLAAGPGYPITPKAARRLDEAAARIYRTGRVSLGRPVRPARAGRPGAPGGTAQRLAANLSFLGYGTLDEQTWVATRPGRGRRPAAHRGRRPLRAVHRRARRRHPRRDGAWSAAPGTWPRSARPTSGSSPSSARCSPRSPCAAATRRRTRPGSGSCTRGARSSSATRSCPRRCCPSAGPAPPRPLLRPARGPAAAGRRPVRRPLPRRRQPHRPTEGSLDT